MRYLILCSLTAPQVRISFGQLMIICLVVRDMVFMTEEQRMRHTAKPGLSGLAQVMGRNAISWEEKFKWDLKYIENVSFLGDFKVVCLTVKKVFGKSESSNELDVAADYGDELLKAGTITREEYETKQLESRKILKSRDKEG